MGKIIEATAVISARAGDMSGLETMAANLMKVSKVGQQVKAAIGGAAVDLNKRVTEIGAQLAKIDNFRTMSRGLDQASIAMKAAQQNAARLKTVMDATNAPTRKMQSDFTRASAAVEKATQAFRGQGQAVREARSALEAAGIPVNTIARQQALLTQSLNSSTRAMERQAQASRTMSGSNRAAARSSSYVPHTSNMIRHGVSAGDSGVGRHGAGVAVGVHTGLRLARHGAEAANDLSNATNQARMSGMTPEQVQVASVKAAELSRRYPTVSQAEIIRMIQSQMAVTGDFHHGMDAIADNVRLRAVVRMKDPHAPLGEQFEYLNKGMEILGQTSDPAKHHAAMQSIARATNFFGHTINLEDYYQMAIRSKGAASRMSTDFMFGVMPTLASEMRGASAGNALYSFNRAIVGGAMKHSAIKTLADMGLVDESKVDKTKTGSIKGIRPGGIHGWQVAQSDPDRWVAEYLKPAFAKKGVTDPDKADAVLTSMFSSGTAAQFVKLLWNQAARIEKDRAGIARAEGLEAAERNQSRDTGTAIAGVNTAFQNLTATLTGPVLERAVPVINEVSGALNRLANWGQENPGQAGAVGLATLGGATVAASAGASWFLGRVGAALGLGGGGAGGAAAAGAAGGAATGGLLGTLASGGARILSSPFGMILTSQALLEAGKPTSKAGFPYRFDTWSPDAMGIYERSRRIDADFRQDQEGARGRAMMAQSSRVEAVPRDTAKVEVSGRAEISVPPIVVTVSSEFLRVVSQAKPIVTSVPLSGGAGSTGASMPHTEAPDTGRFGRN